MANGKHIFAQLPGGRAPQSCLRCGLPPDNPIHVQLLDQAIEKFDKVMGLEALPRLARSELLMQVAELYAQRSSCTRGHVGAVLVKDGRIISAGYNGAPPGMAHCLDVGCEELTVKPVVGGGDFHDEYVELGCQRTIHAEANAIVWAARMGVPTLDSTMYSTHSPCASCARLLVAAGICRLYYRNDYRLARLDILDQACVPVEKL